MKDLTQSTAEVLDAAGVEWGVLGKDEKCCGYMPLVLGYPELFERYALDAIDAFNKSGVKQIVTSCPECYYMFKVRYPKVAPLNAEVVHVTEFMHRLIKEGFNFRLIHVFYQKSFRNTTIINVAVRATYIFSITI